MVRSVPLRIHVLQCATLTLPELKHRSNEGAAATSSWTSTALRKKGTYCGRVQGTRLEDEGPGLADSQHCNNKCPDAMQSVLVSRCVDMPF